MEKCGVTLHCLHRDLLTLMNVSDILKELLNYKRKLFLYQPQKIDGNTANNSKLLFFSINLHFVTSNQISTFRKLNLPLNQYLLRLLTSRNAKKTQTDQSMPRVFLLCLKRNDPQTFKSGSCKHSFLQCVCYWYSLLR